MLVTKHITLEPYGFMLYAMSTQNLDEDRNANDLFSKESLKLGIKESFQHDDGRDYESAFAYDVKNHKYVGCIYIRNMKIDELALDHELIHVLNCINEKYAISTKFGEDESVACFFEYMKENFLKLLNDNGIRIIRKRFKKLKSKIVN